jgi:hypothetical protein
MHVMAFHEAAVQHHAAASFLARALERVDHLARRGELGGLGREGFVALGELQRMRQALAVEAQVAREATGVFEGLQVL